MKQLWAPHRNGYVNSNLSPRAALAALLVLTAAAGAADEATIRVAVGAPGPTLSPLLLGNNLIATRGAGGPALYDAQSGEWRPRVLDAAKALRPTILRFPGGGKSERYHWEDGVGEQPRNPDYEFGTDEWMQLCETVGAEPMITANWLTGSPALAARWVEYCNGPASSPCGKKRANNDHAEPYGVRYWEIGNEPTHTSQIRDYALTLDAYAHAMKRADPDILIGGAAWQWRGWMNHYRPDDVPWTETLLGLAGEHLDFLVIHPYLWISEAPTVDDQFVEAALAYPEHLDRWLAETREMCVEAGYPNLPIFATEYNGYYGGLGMSPALVQHFNGVLLCETLHSFIEAGLEGACYWELATIGWDHFANIMLAEGKHFALRPTYHALKLYRDHFSGRLVPSEVDCESYAAPRVGVIPAQSGVPSLDAVAAVREDGSLVVGCAWRRTGEPCEVSVEVSGRQIASATVHALVADGPLATNTSVRTSPAQVSRGVVTFELPPISAAVVVVD